MSDLFKSAFEYFSGPTNNSSENNFVGQIVEISNVKLKIKKVIAEGRFSVLIFIYYNVLFVGGFAIVYVAQDITRGTEYALKVLLLF